MVQTVSSDSSHTKAALLVLLVVVLIAVVVYLIPARELAVDVINRVQSYGAIAPVAYFFLFATAAIAGISRTLMTIVAGILFSPVVAVVVVMAALMTTFTITFMVARHYAADWVAARLEKIPTAKALLSAVEQHGFRLLVLMRLNPFVPGVVNDYGFGLTSIGPRTYFLASLLGALPLALIYTYLGWAGGQSMLHAGSETQGLQSATLAAGVVLSVILIIAISWYGHRAVAAAGKETA